MKSTKNKKHIIVIFIILLIVLFSVFIEYFYYSPAKIWNKIFEVFNVSDVTTKTYDSDMIVHILDVGKADAIYIKCKDKNILIDAGDVEVTNPVTEYLQKQNVNKLDFVMLSHPHRDHFGGLPDIINKFEIDEFMMSEVPEEITPTTKTYEKMLLALQQKNIKIDKPVLNDFFNIGDICVNILAPVKKYDTANNNSIVAKFTYGNESFLFTGDIEKEAENDILNMGYDLNSTVLKVGHHGSATSSTQAFLDSVSAKYAVISVGSDRNNLPKLSTVKRLQNSVSNLYRTDLNGTVIFTTNGDGIKIFTEKE